MRTRLWWTVWAAGMSVAAAAVAQDGGEQPPKPETPEEQPGQPPEEAAPEEQPAQPPIEIVQPAPLPPPQPRPPEPETQVGGFHLNFRDGVDLNVLVDYIAKELDLQIIIQDGNLLGQKVFLPTPIRVPEDQVLRLLNLLLEQKGFTLKRDAGTGIYFISQTGDVDALPGADQFSTTRVIPTQGLRPSSLAQPIAVLGVTSGQGSPGVQPRGPAAQIAYLDDLGLILMTGTARQTALVEGLVQRLVHEQSLIRFQRLELRHVAASYARDRVLELEGVGSGVQRPQVRVAPGANPGNQPNPAVLGATGTTLLNLEDRLTVDPQGNALLFRGRPDEISELTRRLEIVDVPNALISRWYGVGRAALAVAQEGGRQALGDVTTEQGGILDVSGQFSRGFSGSQVGALGQIPGQRAGGGLQGTGFVVFPEAGGFMYRGTESQHAQVQRLIDSLSELTSAELVVVEFYKLRHADATEVEEIINNLLNNQQGTGSSDLLGRDLARGGARDRRSRTNASPLVQQGQPGADGQPQAGADGAGEGDISAVRATEDTFVLADEANNQVVVKAPKRMQPQFARLIERLDLRRPQVYIDAKIVAITGSDDFRMAFETQIVAGQFGLNTDFGLGDPGNNILAPKTVPGSVGPFNLTAAVVRSDFVPVLLTVLQSNTNSRILSTPQLLVDDNEEAEVISVNREPYGAISRDPGAGADIITQGGEAEAGTTLRIKPQISEGGYLNLEYEIELSSFTGQPREGLAPPSQVNNIRSDSVTVPSDTTIVVGGLTFTSDVNTVFKIPLLGDLPLLGHLFRDTSVSKTTTTLYIFITPTIMRDPNFTDLRLLTRGPAAEAGVAVDLPHQGAVRIDILDRTARPVAPPPMLEAPVSPSTPGRPEDEPVGAMPGGWIPPSRSGGSAEGRR